MQRAWVVLLAGCGFQSAALDDAGTMMVPGDAPIDQGIASTVGRCWTIDDTVNVVHWSRCTDSFAGDIHITANTVVNTDAAPSSSNKLSCAILAAGGIGEAV